MRKFSLVFFLISFSLLGQNSSKTCETLSKINDLIQQEHFRPKKVDDSLSVFIFNTFLKTIDPLNELFLESEIINLKKYKYKLDDNIKKSNCIFLNDFYNATQKAVNRNVSIIENIKKEKFPESSLELARFNRKVNPYLKTEKELISINKKRMLFNILNDIADKSKNKDSLVSVFPSVFETSKQKVFDNYSCEASKYNITMEEFCNLFFKVFCSYFDPHTDFFSTNQKSDYISAINSDNFTLGIDFFVKAKNDISIVQILPGSPGYFSEKLEIGDQLVKVKSKQEEYMITCNNFEKIAKILSSSEYKNVSLTLKKKSGEVYTANLYKQVMRDYQNSVYSYILERENQKTGYIKIPSFYSTSENGKTNVSDDVAKEINQLKADKITGLIIDLENNGGGSMEEAILLCGLFISAPELAQVVTRTNQKEIIHNLKPKNIYTGPIIIIINGFSASASEFFANAMQDYNLALIVGAKSLGKASIQSIFPLKNENDKFLKITIGKFYRVTGKSNQLIGVTPNIEIPSIFDNQMPKEKDFATAFKNDKIESIVNKNKYPMSEKQKEAILQYNLKNKTSVEYQKNIHLKASFDQFFAQTFTVKLQFNNVFEQSKEFSKRWKEIETYINYECSFAITNTNYDTQKIQSNSYLKSVNNTQIKYLKTNFRVFESIKIMACLK